MVHQLAPDLAEELGGHAEVGGDVFQGDVLLQRRVLFAEIKVSLLGCRRNALDDPEGMGDQGVLKDDPEVPLELHVLLQ